MYWTTPWEKGSIIEGKVRWCYNFSSLMSFQTRATASFQVDCVIFPLRARNKSSIVVNRLLLVKIPKGDKMALSNLSWNAQSSHYSFEVEHGRYSLGGTDRLPRIMKWLLFLKRGPGCIYFSASWWVEHAVTLLRWLMRAVIVYNDHYHNGLSHSMPLLSCALPLQSIP